MLAGQLKLPTAGETGKRNLTLQEASLAVPGGMSTFPSNPTPECLPRGWGDVCPLESVSAEDCYTPDYDILEADHISIG